MYISILALHVMLKGGCGARYKRGIYVVGWDHYNKSINTLRTLKTNSCMSINVFAE